MQTRGAMRMKVEEAEDLLSRVKPGQVTVGILPYYTESLCLLIDYRNTKDLYLCFGSGWEVQKRTIHPSFNTIALCFFYLSLSLMRTANTHLDRF